MTCRPLLQCLLASLLFASCATVPPSVPADARHPGLPPETPFASAFGTEHVLCLNLQNERGENWRFLVDSGSPVTILDRSLRPKLGPPVGLEPVQYAWSGSATLQIHAAPRLFLNRTLLLTGARVRSDDLRRVWPGRHVEGILGLDCLQNYCIQLDFVNRTIRFLNSEQAAGPALGRAFPLYVLPNGIFIEGDLLGAGPALYQVDTGCTVDAVMKPALFHRAWERQSPEWARQFPTGEGRPVIEANFPRGTFGGETYEKLIVDAADHSFLGLRFLSRHLVTINFPKHTMYLRRI